MAEAISRKRIAIFCGSRVGKNPVDAEAAKELASAMAASNLDLVMEVAE